MRTNLVVPYDDRHQVKALGARWDVARKVWFVPDGTDLFPFLEWVEGLPVLSKKVKATLKRGRRKS